jgi:hypothetical protein
MNKYRIKKTIEYGIPIYIPQKKVLWWWWGIHGFDDIEDAKNTIRNAEAEYIYDEELK